MIEQSLHTKLENMAQRLREIDGLLADPGIRAHPAQGKQLGRERSALDPIVSCFNRYRQSQGAADSAMQMTRDPDPEIQTLAQEELRNNKKRCKLLEEELRHLLLPRDPDDNKNVFLEIRAGTGGQEAALFVNVLLRMYCRYTEMQGWKAEIISAQPTSLDGYREVILRVSGGRVYALLKFESGVHRVQRVPETESQGRIHTSACTVAVLPEADAIDSIEIQNADLRVDTFRASGAGGQHVNKTDSAVRITHLPTNTVVECQDERSQHRNRAKAISLLKARLLDAARRQQQQQQAQSRRSMVGSGDRSERIRTYNFPQNRVTDHRIPITLYRLEAILLGELNDLVEPLNNKHRAEQLEVSGT